MHYSNEKPNFCTNKSPHLGITIITCCTKVMPAGWTGQISGTNLVDYTTERVYQEGPPGRLFSEPPQANFILGKLGTLQIPVFSMESLWLSTQSMTETITCHNVPVFLVYLKLKLSCQFILQIKEAPNALCHKLWTLGFPVSKYGANNFGPAKLLVLTSW